MTSIQERIQLLRKNGLKITPQRRRLLEMLNDDQSHPTAEQVYQRLLLDMPDVSRTTVYNTLHELVRLGKLVPVEAISEHGLRYDSNTHDHHHLLCLGCHQLVDIQDNFEGVILPTEKAGGYQVLKYQVTFSGYCPDCQISSRDQHASRSSQDKPA